MIAFTGQSIAAASSFLSQALPMTDGGERTVLVTFKPTNVTWGYSAVFYVSVDGVDYYQLLTGGVNHVGSTQVLPVPSGVSFRSIILDISGARYLKVQVNNLDATNANTFEVKVWPYQDRK